jgi:DNA-binding CsgD family transcriptional regulator
LEIRDAQLRHKVRSALGAWPGASGDGTLRLSSGERTLDLTRLQVSFSKSRAYAISLVQSSELKMTREVLVKRLRLTRAQAQVAALIYDGSNQVSVAERLGVSINTVKTHMKGIFAKAGVRSQRGLIRKVGELLGRG